MQEIDMAVTNMRPVLYRSFIKDQIISEIMNGTLKPGDHLVESQIAKKYQISPSPVREALRELETVGMVESFPYKGCFVKETSKIDSLNYYSIRQALEILAIQSMPNKPDEKLAEEMRRVYGQLLQVSIEGKKFDFITQDTVFHQILIDRSENDLLKQLWGQCMSPQYLVLCNNYRNEDLIHLAKNHLPYCEAAESGKKANLIAAVRSHYQYVGKKNNS